MKTNRVNRIMFKGILNGHLLQRTLALAVMGALLSSCAPVQTETD